MLISRARILLGQMIGDPKLVIVTGKGGVGKSSVSRLLARLAQLAGLHPLLVLFDDLATYREGDDLEVLVLKPEPVMVEYLESHGFGALAGHMAKSGVLGAVSTAIPGIRDLLLLAKLNQLVNAAKHDVIILDAPASGHALSLLTSPEGLGGIATEGPVATQSIEVLELLRDHEKTGAVIVTLPEETPIQEAEELMARLGGPLGVNVLSCVVNQMPPGLPAGAELGLADGSAEAAAFHYRLGRYQAAAAHVSRVESAFGSRVALLPWVGFRDDVAETADHLASALGEGQL